MTPPAALSTIGYPILPDAPVDLASWRDSALQRGYRYRDSWQDPALTGLLFNEGYGTVATDVIDALSSPVPFIAGSLTATYTAPGGRVTSSFIAIPLSRSMPSLVLVNARAGALRRAEINLGTREMLVLPGGFDRLFTLYRPIGRSGAAVEVFTPELIEMFLQIMPGSDAELVADWIFVYGGEERNTSRDSLDRIERIAARVHEAILRRNFDDLHEVAAPVVEPVHRRRELLLFSSFLTIATAAAGALALVLMTGH